MLAASKGTKQDLGLWGRRDGQTRHGMSFGSTGGGEGCS